MTTVTKENFDQVARTEGFERIYQEFNCTETAGRLKVLLQLTKMEIGPSVGNITPEEHLNMLQGMVINGSWKLITR